MQVVALSYRLKWQSWIKPTVIMRSKSKKIIPHDFSATTCILFNISRQLPCLDLGGENKNPSFSHCFIGIKIKSFRINKMLGWPVMGSPKWWWFNAMPIREKAFKKVHFFITKELCLFHAQQYFITENCIH